MPVVVSLPHPTDPGTVYTSAEPQRNRTGAPASRARPWRCATLEIDQQGVAALTYPR